jgi:uncharacterized protein YndB with AHSA1/START domain
MTTMNKPSARAVADVTRGTILAAVEIAVPPERVFRALTEGSEITRWWGADDLYRTTSWTADLRVGGEWRAGGVGADGHEFTVGGEFLEIDPPRKVVQTWVAAWDGGNTTTLTYLIEATDSGSRVTVRHEGFADRADSCRGHGEGWVRVLGWLTSFVVPPAPKSPHFLCRLIAPRPSFAMDMSDAERKIMQAHSMYWRKRLDEGTAIVFGPVADPSGPWGLGVVRAENEAALRAFQAEDPAIAAGVGFRYENLPMLSAVYRE